MLRSRVSAGFHQDESDRLPAAARSSPKDRMSATRFVGRWRRIDRDKALRNPLLQGNMTKVLISIAIWLPYMMLSERVNLTYRSRLPA